MELDSAGSSRLISGKSRAADQQEQSSAAIDEGGYAIGVHPDDKELNDAMGVNLNEGTPARAFVTVTAMFSMREGRRQRLVRHLFALVRN